MAKKVNKVAIKKVKKTQAEEEDEFIRFLKSDKGKKLFGDEKKMRKVMKDTDKFLGLKF